MKKARYWRGATGVWDNFEVTFRNMRLGWVSDRSVFVEIKVSHLAVNL